MARILGNLLIISGFLLIGIFGYQYWDHHQAQSKAMIEAKNRIDEVAITAFPGQSNQIVLSGHRDTVFRNFGEFETGDRYIVEMPYGKYEYEIRKKPLYRKKIPPL
ncbi:sortase domain-containing protein [Salibacterium aidingense]|uniref:sortase domain-containing protein n=1 Tax=Salibacterium aidingense TaxID=384933 RepID=UPI0004221E05|nr:sortase [Salibacterium aidingense]